MAPNKINFVDKFSKLPDEDYSVRIVAKMNNYEFKIVKFKAILYGTAMQIRMRLS